jgi:hypothetical protein
MIQLLEIGLICKDFYNKPFCLGTARSDIKVGSGSKLKSKWKIRSVSAVRGFAALLNFVIGVWDKILNTT